MMPPMADTPSRRRTTKPVVTDIVGGDAGLAPLPPLPPPARKPRRRAKAAALPALEPIRPIAPTESLAPIESAVAIERSEPAPRDDEPLRARIATAEELDDWDAQAVATPNGHVYQSRTWAEFRAAHGAHPWHIAFNDGFRLLVLGRPHAGSAAPAYASRGPIPEPDPARTAERAALAAELLGAAGAPALIVDGEAPVTSGLGGYLERAGFEPADDVQPTRHRMDVHLGPDDAPNSDEKTIFASFGANTRNLIRQSERHGLRIRRLDAGGGRIEDDYAASEPDEFDRVDFDDAAGAMDMLRALHSMLNRTGQPDAEPASEAAFLDWSQRAIAAGHAFYLVAEHPQDGPVAGAAFYRHGHRLTYWFAGEDAHLRRTYPGAARLLIWRGIQVALDERRTVVDLGGADSAVYRERPDKGDPTYGAYQLRESFGARWVELTGAYRRNMHPLRSNVGRVAAAALRRLGRLAR